METSVKCSCTGNSLKLAAEVRHDVETVLILILNDDKVSNVANLT